MASLQLGPSHLSIPQVQRTSKPAKTGEQRPLGTLDGYRSGTSEGALHSFQARCDYSTWMNASDARVALHDDHIGLPGSDAIGHGREAGIKAGYFHLWQRSQACLDGQPEDRSAADDDPLNALYSKVPSIAIMIIISDRGGVVY